jgi:RNA polymerase sigma factor (sigma-70 family)
MPNPVLRYLRAALGPDAGPGDAELLARFVAGRDEAAFELLVWRHAGAVRRACEVVLRDRHLAEDAAQATFLALARKAGSVRRPEAVGGWLLRVARRVAVRAARRPRPECTDLEHVPASASVHDAEMAWAVRDAVAELPERYRLPVLLCFFEGLTHAEAAARLGWPVGTVAGRLARAKDRLGAALNRRGVTGTAGALLAVADVNAVSHEWVRQTATAAAAFAAGRAAVPGVSGSVLQLAKGTVWAMTATKLKWAAGVVTACGVLATGGAWVTGQGRPTAPLAAPADSALKGNVFVQTGNDAFSLERPQTRVVGQRAFLVGKSINSNYSGSPSFIDRTVWVPVDAVTMMAELDEASNGK